MPTNCSCSWRAILNERKDDAFMARHIIGDSSSTRIWLDPSHHMRRLKDFFQQALSYSSVCYVHDKVSSLIENNRWSIPGQVRRHIPEAIDIIEETNIGGGSDEIILAPSKNGVYTL